MGSELTAAKKTSSSSVSRPRWKPWNGEVGFEVGSQPNHFQSAATKAANASTVANPKMPPVSQRPRRRNASAIALSTTSTRSVQHT